MKPFFDEFDRLGLWRKMALLFFAFVLTAAAGCSKSSKSPDAAPQAAPPPASPTVSADAAPTPTPTPAPISQSTTTTNSTSMTTLQYLNRAMLRWVRTNHRRPRDFEEFAGSSNVQIPNPPPGKKYALNGRGFVILVDSSTQ